MIRRAPAADPMARVYARIMRAYSFTAGGTMGDKERQEEFETGLAKIRQEIKGRLVAHGLYGSIAHFDAGPQHAAAGSPQAAAGPSVEVIEIIVKGRRVVRSFERQQIEHCCLRVGGAVLLGLIAMIEELAAAPPSMQGSEST
jgi:hypothetical protein